jgi:prohibitin 2
MAKRFSDVSADITDLQVSNIKRPSSYEKVVRDKEAAKENIAIALNERPRKLVQAKSLKEDAKKNGQIAEQTAQSRANILMSKTNAQVSSILARYDAEARAFSTLMKKQNLTSEGLLSYLSTRVLAEKNTTVSVALDAPARTKYTY